jgi:2-amino-4-hydroxy-6-hydroxymethyldihydropteridine diphosphokinase
MDKNKEKSTPIILSLGSNYGKREEYLKEAINRLQAYCTDVEVSSLYQTPSWGYDGGDYLNLCVWAKTTLNAQELLHTCMSIEKELGRVRTDVQYTDRTLDIDIISFGNRVVDQENLQIPHPRMNERNFVLIPLLELQKNWIHPILQKSISELYLLCKDEGEITWYGKI